ncbi:hypothetical protein IV203_025381 [Nitzschia inconspicua]|uniref:Uncharacterized protein n=1 Tax=Nitzschia inconspicua TaxID=303405 RepID=A0A9K3K9J9_9STRA|nr:hypothetical protein IV203_024812 [Nitzschia inconspicua]KAG7362497.1 hypothetical protein IV203_025381 [Nitzschia inconspicua]
MTSQGEGVREEETSRSRDREGSPRMAVDIPPVYVPPPSNQDDIFKESSGSSPSSSGDRKALTTATLTSPSSAGLTPSKISSNHSHKSKDRAKRRGQRRRKSQDDGVSKLGSVISISVAKSRQSSSQAGVTNNSRRNSSDVYTASNTDTTTANTRINLTSPPTREIYIPLKSSSSGSDQNDDEDDDDEQQGQDQDDGTGVIKNNSFHSILSMVSALTIPTSLETSPTDGSPLILLRRPVSDGLIIFTPETPMAPSVHDIHKKPPALPARYLSSDDSQSHEQAQPVSDDPAVPNFAPIDAEKAIPVQQTVTPIKDVGEITPPRYKRRNLAKPTPPLRKRSNDGLVPLIPQALFRSSTAPAFLEGWDMDNRSSNNNDPLRKWKLEPRRPRRHSDQMLSPQSTRTQSSSLERKKPERKHSGASIKTRRASVVDERSGHERGRLKKSNSNRDRQRGMNPHRSVTPQGRADSMDDYLTQETDSSRSPVPLRRTTRNDSIELAKRLKSKQQRSAPERMLRSLNFVRPPSPSNRSLSPEQVFEPTYNPGSSFTRRSTWANATRSSSRLLNGKMSPKHSSNNSFSLATPTTANCTTSLSSFMDDSSGGYLLSTKSGSQRSRSLSSVANSVYEKPPSQRQQEKQQQCPPIHPMPSSLSSQIQHGSCESLTTMSSTSSRPPLASPSASDHSSQNYSARSLGSTCSFNSGLSLGDVSSSRQETSRWQQKFANSGISNTGGQCWASPLSEDPTSELSRHALTTISPLSLSPLGSPCMESPSCKLRRRRFVQE